MQVAEHPTSLTLLDAMRGESQEAWAKFVHTYGPLMLVWCRRCGLRDEDAADVCQEVFVGLPKSIHLYDPTVDGATFRGWLWTVVRNRLRDLCRRQLNQPVGTGGTTAMIRIASIPDRSPETSEDVANLHLRVLTQLKSEFKESTWTAFWRVVVEEDAVADVANDLGTTVWAVYKARARVLARLKAELISPEDYRALS